MSKTARIVCQPDGPYHLQGDAPVRRASGASCPTKSEAWLCRCGGSKNKPFCDGTHKKIGFKDTNTADPSRNKRERYAGKRITILDNRAICAHAGHCTDGLSAVFRMRQEPWIDADGADAAAIMATIRKCPSGALSYAIDGVEAAPPQRPSMITVTDDGPYAIVGAVELPGIALGEGASREHYTLCRCGASKNKPFCDGSHWDAGFKDAG